MGNEPVVAAPPSRRLRGAALGARPADALVDALQPEGQDDEEDAEDDRVDTDNPGDRQRALEWPERQQQAEDNREDPAQEHPDLTRDLLSQMDGIDDLQHTRHQ